MAGYVLTTQVLASIRTLVRGVLGHVTSPDDDTVLAQEVDRHMQLADGLDADDLREVATWARERARLASDAEPTTNSAHYRRGKLAEYARVTELCTDMLEALALSKLPSAALLVIGSEDEPADFAAQVCKALGLGDTVSPDLALTFIKDHTNQLNSIAEALGAEDEDYSSLPGIVLRRCVAEVEPAANSKMSREQVEALPSADRVALGQILATLRGEPRTAKPHEGAAVDVLVELDVYLRKLASNLGLELVAEAPALADAAYQVAYDRNKWKSATADAQRHASANFDELTKMQATARGFISDVAEALGLKRSASRGCILDAARSAGDRETEPPTYALPDSHPLRSYRWGDWLRCLVRREEAAAGSGCWVPDSEGLGALREALARVDALDADGLGGLALRIEEKCRRIGRVVLTLDELALLNFAAGRSGVQVTHTPEGSLVRGCNRVPRVGGGE